MTLTSLDEQVASLSGEAADQKKMPTYRKLFIAMLGNRKAGDLDEAFHSMRLVQTLKATTDVVLTDKDAALMIKALSANACSYSAWIQGQLADRLSQATKAL